jgi:xanthine/uracil permease
MTDMEKTEAAGKTPVDPNNPAGVLYTLDSKPPLPKATVLALQHVLTMFGATVAVPLLLGPAMNMSPQNIAVLISSVMLCSGLATLCQVTIGTRLPIIQGVSFSFLAPFFAIIGWVSSEVSKGAIAPELQGQVTMQYIAGAVLVGSVFEIIIGYTGLVGLLKKYLTPVVIGPVIMLIGLSLFQHGAPKAGADVFVSGITIFCIILFSLVLSRKIQFFRIFPILLSVLIAWTLCTALSVTKVYEPATFLVKSTKDLAANPKLKDRYRAVKISAVLAIQGKLKAESGKLGAQITGYYAQSRAAVDDEPAKKTINEAIQKVVKEKETAEKKIKTLASMANTVVGDSCFVLSSVLKSPDFAEFGLSSASLSERGLSAIWETDKEATVTPLGVLAPAHPSYVYLNKVNDAKWVRVNPAELVLPWGVPKFNFGFIIAVLFAYLASMIESFGDYHACSYMAGAGTPTARQVSNGIGSEGIGCAITGFLGGFASTSYSENIGLIGLTKVASRYVVIIASFLLIGLGLISKFGAIAATLPSPVVGALYCTLFGLISAVGIQQLSKADLSSDRTLFIAGFALFMGLSVPTFFTAKTAGLAPGDLQAVYLPTADAFLTWFPGQVSEIIATVGKSGMGVAALIGLVLDNVIPGTDEERGIL